MREIIPSEGSAEVLARNLKSEALLPPVVSLQTKDLPQQQKREGRGQTKRCEEQDKRQRKTIHSTLKESKLLI